MKNSFLFLVIQAIKEIIASIFNFIFTTIYLCLPVGLFMLVMQLRDKNNKISAISAFTEDNSEFQFIFANYLLVAVTPNSLKARVKRTSTNINKFIEKWKWSFIVGLLSILILVIFLRKFI